jgi:MFS family permease
VVKGSVRYAEIARVLLRKHLKRSILGFVLMVSQAFAYNAIFFTYALVLSRFYDIPGEKVGLYLLPFALGNLLGPILLGRWFDTWGRRKMIALTYAIAGTLLAITGDLFAQGYLTAVTQTALWSCVFFVASAAASSAYLTVSELFPVELRGMAIALFYAVGTATGGLAAPAIFGALIQTGSRVQVMKGYFFGAALMIAASCVAAIIGVDAERKSLEELNE